MVNASAIGLIACFFNYLQLCFDKSCFNAGSYMQLYVPETAKIITDGGSYDYLSESFDEKGA
jgi:hypothetical protein